MDRCIQKTKMVILLQFFVVSVIISNVSGLRIGAFNIQVFGKSKASKPEVMEILVGIISRYDFVLIQEIRDSSGDAIDTLLDEANKLNAANPFRMSLSDRLGRTNSKEQYAFFYRPSAFSIVDQYIYEDGDESLNTKETNVDKFQREPYVVLVESKRTEMKRFAVAGIHVDPGEAVQELQHLEHVFDDIKARFNIDDVMVMGDLNADCSYVPKYKWNDIPIKSSPDYVWLITDDIDTTVSGSDCAYDRFIITGQQLIDSVIPGSSRVFLFDNHFELNESQAKAVSDHYPIEVELKDATSGSPSPCLPVYFTGLCLIVTIVFVRSLVTHQN